LVCKSTLNPPFLVMVRKKVIKIKGLNSCYGLQLVGVSVVGAFYMGQVRLPLTLALPQA
jgi:hypothetical protein